MAADESPNLSKPSQGGMPPGMVMGPDGKPCKICTAFRNWKPQTTNHTEPDSKRDTQSGSRVVKTSAAHASQKSKSTAVDPSMAIFSAASAFSTSTTTEPSKEPIVSTHRPDEPPPGCPPDVEQLGRATWTFLHTTAAYYPEKPTPTQRANMLMLLRSLPILYPCTWCADDFGKDIMGNPPDVSGRMALSKWLCERHNEVNKKLGKETFDCAKVDERWKDGPADGSCD